MTEKKFATQGVMSPRQAEALVSKIIYSVEGISDCFLDPETRQVVVGLNADCDVPRLEKTIGLLIGWEKDHRVFSHRVRKESAAADAPGEPTHEVEPAFARDGAVRRGLAVRLFDALDALFVEWAYRFGAHLRQYPAMIPLRTLEKCRYIQSFPQNVHFVAEIPHRLDALERVKEAGPLGDIARLSSYALSPAVCFHCYEELSGRRLSEPEVLTARGACFRHEAPWRLGKHRLNEFSMREIVLFGDADYVETAREAYMDKVWNAFESLGLAGKMETASDPFYFSEDAAKSQHQLMANMKFELIAAAGGEAFSIASFNYMGDTLCRPFDVCDPGGKPLHSGCIAFGIDRWVYALLRAHGTEYERWPARVRSVLERSEAR